MSCAPCIFNKQTYMILYICDKNVFVNHNIFSSDAVYRFILYIVLSSIICGSYSKMLILSRILLSKQPGTFFFTGNSLFQTLYSCSRFTITDHDVIIKDPRKQIKSSSASGDFCFRRMLHFYSVLP